MSKKQSAERHVAGLAGNALRQKFLRHALASSEFREAMHEAATEIRGAATPEANEATVEGYFERVLYAHLKEIGLKFHPQKEATVQTRRHVTHGRADSRLGGLVIEYKRPSALKTVAAQRKAIDQLSNYVASLSAESASPFVGVLTDGQIVIEVRALAGEVSGETAKEVVSADTLTRLTRHFVSLALTALTPENLIRDFCGADGALFKTARILNQILSDRPHPKTRMLHSEWEEMFRLAHDDQSQQQKIEDRRTSLAELFQVSINDPPTEYRALFALHTAYAIILKLLAYRIVSDVFLGGAAQDFRSLATTTSASLRAFCNSLEDGEVFRQLGILNLLEGDFFSWYSAPKQWTPNLASAIADIVAILARYEETQNIFEAGAAPDLFRELYQAAVPAVVRSSFGEFYTPLWLADCVIQSAQPRDDWRALDPCCGSGTFVIAAIARLRETSKKSGADLLRDIVARVAAIDLNPLGVLTTRIHYFVHISDLLAGWQGELVIPVFLGDAAASPDTLDVDGQHSLRFRLKTLKSPIDAVLPVSLVQDTPAFIKLMMDYERAIQAEGSQPEQASAVLFAAMSADQLTPTIVAAIENLSSQLCELERKGWNGIWARILSNFLTTACLGKFSILMGNPPWIDWKNLPEGYRERIKGLCIERGLFSGAGRTGGINLNVCALISYVCLNNWLAPGGKLAFLMPKELGNQASYEGWRRLGGRWHFSEFDDWSRAGHPFDPVKEDFMTFVIEEGQSDDGSVPTTSYVKRKGVRAKAASWKDMPYALSVMDRHEGVAGQIIPNSTAFTFASSETELRQFQLVAGRCEYIGREGAQFYPQELVLFRYERPGPKPGTAWLKNIQVKKAKYRIPAHRVLLDTEYLRPLVTAPTLKAFEHNYDELLAPFPYTQSSPGKPLEPGVLSKQSPLLLAYYQKHREVIEKLSPFNKKIRGPDPGAFYGIARTGPYSFAKAYVAFRKDTEWCASVIASIRTPWGSETMPVFQSHAVSMCERSDRTFITEEEAHFICAIFNAPIVRRFIEASSDERSYKVRPPIFVPLFTATDARHTKLAELSKQAHRDAGKRPALMHKIEEVYLQICADKPADALSIALEDAE